MIEKNIKKNIVELIELHIESYPLGNSKNERLLGNDKKKYS